MTGRLEALGARPTVGDLRRTRDMLAATGDASGIAVANALGVILRGGDAVSALGLKPAGGQRSALTVDRMVSRDDLLRRMADRHYAGLSVSEQARQIEEAASAYWRRAARLDTDLEDIPESYVGMPREFLFHVARLPATVPSRRTIRLILSDR